LGKNELSCIILGRPSRRANAHPRGLNWEVIYNLSYLADGRMTFEMVTTICLLDHYFHFSN